MADSKEIKTDGGVITGAPNEREQPQVINPSAMKFGPDWLKWCFLTGWALFLAYLLFLAVYKTDRTIDARQPFDERSMELVK